VVKVEDVRLQVVGTLNQVLKQSTVVRRFEPVRILLCQDRGHAVGDRAHTADSLGDLLRIQRIAPLEDFLDAAEHLTFTVGFLNTAALLAPRLLIRGRAARCGRRFACRPCRLFSRSDRFDFGVDRQMAFDASHRTQRQRAAHVFSP